MYPRIGFFRKLPYPRIRILPIPIRVSVSVLHSFSELRSSLNIWAPDDSTAGACRLYSCSPSMNAPA